MKYTFANMSYPRHDSPHGLYRDHRTFVNETEWLHSLAVRETSVTCNGVNERAADTVCEEEAASITGLRGAESELRELLILLINLHRNMAQSKGYQNPQGRSPLNTLFASIYGARINASTAPSAGKTTEELVSISDHVGAKAVM